MALLFCDTNFAENQLYSYISNLYLHDCVQYVILVHNIATDDNMSS